MTNSIGFTPFTPFSSSYDPVGGTASAGTANPASSAGSVAPAASTSGTGGADQLAPANSNSLGLSTNDFMNLFLAQLQNQDPTQPMDDSQMLSQLSQMTEIQTLQGVQTSLQGSQLAQSSALIGKNVTGVDVNGTAVNGVVTSVTQSTDAGLVLQVGSQYIKPDSVTEVTAPATTGTGTGS